MQLKFYYCRHCGKIISMVKDGAPDTICCGEKMAELVPGTSDGDQEKHIPVIKISGNKVSVTVGSKIHPSVNEHYIEWILLQTDKTIQQKWLNPGNPPEAEFAIMVGEKVEAAYEYCNLHQLWRAENGSKSIV